MRPSRFNCYQVQRKLATLPGKLNALWVPVDDNFYPYQTAVNTMDLIISRRANGYVPEYRVSDATNTPRFKELIEQE